MPGTPYVYVMVREDLPLEQQLVQSNHATLEAGFRFPAPRDTAHLIMLAVPDRPALEAAAARLDRHGVDHHLFFEPDFGIGHSALATRPLFGKERHLMRKYPLYRATNFLGGVRPAARGPAAYSSSLSSL